MPMELVLHLSAWKVLQDIVCKWVSEWSCTLSILIWNYQNAFHNGHTNVHKYQQYMKVPIGSYSHTYLIMKYYLIFAKCIIFVVISLWGWTSFHLLVYSGGRGVWVSLLWTSCSIIFAHLFTGLSVLGYGFVVFKNILNLILTVIYIVNLFSQPASHLLTL